MKVSARYCFLLLTALFLSVGISGNGYAADTKPANPVSKTIQKEASSSEIRHSIEEGNRLYAAGNYTSAIENYSSAVQKISSPSDPNRINALYNRGLAYHKMTLYDNAINDFSRVLEISPADASAYLHRGNAFALKKNRLQALEDYTKAIALDPAVSAPYFARGITYQEDPATIDAAIEDFNKVLSISPNDKKTLCFLGIAYYKKRDYKASALYFDQAIAVDSRFKEAYTGRGQANLKRDRSREALEDFSRACEMGEKLGCIMRELLSKNGPVMIR